MVGRVLHQAHTDAILPGERDHPLHKLGAPTVVFRAGIQIDDQHRDMPKALPHGLPPLYQAIREAIARDFGGDP